jgi:hypothetical protein
MVQCGYYSVQCECGGKTNTLPYWKNKHKLTPRHQQWAAENTQKEFVMPKKICKYTCVCGTKMTEKKQRNIMIHELTIKHQKFINEKIQKNEIKLPDK